VLQRSQVQSIFAPSGRVHVPAYSISYAENKYKPHDELLRSYIKLDFRIPKTRNHCCGSLLTRAFRVTICTARYLQEETSCYRT
jgi:hypothetical protein